MRFAGLAVLPLPDCDAAIAELGHALDVLGLDGVALLSNVGGIYHGDDRFAPLWDALDARGAYVFLHPSAPTAPPALAEHPVWLYEFPFDTTRAVVNLIYSGTLERCRQVRLQVAHLGGTAPFLAHRIASLADREPEKAAAAPSGALAALSRLWCDTGLSNHRDAVEAARPCDTAAADRVRHRLAVRGVAGRGRPRARAELPRRRARRRGRGERARPRAPAVHLTVSLLSAPGATVSIVVRSRARS